MASAHVHRGAGPTRFWAPGIQRAPVRRCAASAPGDQVSWRASQLRFKPGTWIGVAENGVLLAMPSCPLLL